ncbi:unnamed protein product [Ostreobium quekettii]|uniref:IFT80/172/WDR35 TPR domain-containing protein n=1 Tax=Ostreobium quekettii TaxID=121088 RepID=A0A8S1J8I1_9CHLO|nr:unnamed protein product [Ostreobium quekettii]
MELVVHLFDEQGEKRDKFKTKPAEAHSTQLYVVRAMAFSPDSMRLAIAQSDNIVFVYRLGLDWGDKKSICNKFVQASPITALAWPFGRQNEIAFGQLDGKMKLGSLKSNKPYSLYAHPEGSPVVSLAGSPNGKVVVAGHADGSVWKFQFPEDEGSPAGHAQVARHACAPNALACGEAIVASGSDKKVVFYSYSGQRLQEFDCSESGNGAELSVAVFNPSGDSVVLGSFNKFMSFSYVSRADSWEQMGTKEIPNMYNITAVAWKPDGSKIAVGSLTGCVDIYDVCVRKNRYKGKFEFTYVSRSAVIVKTLASGTRVVLKSVYGYEIEKINIYQDRYLVARTSDTLLLGDLDTCKLSEIPWGHPPGSDRFHFENEKVCMIYASGELTLVEYGRNDILGCCRTEHMSPFLVSAVVADARGAAPAVKRVAYLVDLQTIRVLDLVAGVALATVNHDAKIDWLELSQRGSHILFRDKKRHLNMYDVSRQDCSTLLEFCQYVQWVPSSDVVVAQSRGNLCVWYNIKNPDQQTVHPIQGEVEDIERANNRTEVIVDEGINTISYALDEALIDFGSALEDCDFQRGIEILEPLELTTETEAQWQQLAEVALAKGEIDHTRRCYTAIGNIAKARYLRKVRACADAVSRSTGANGLESYQVQSMLAVLGGQWAQAERFLLTQGGVDAAVAMYTEAHRWEDAIRVAECHHHEETDSLKRSYYQWLLDSGQEAEAAGVREAEGDYLTAISLYLKGCLPARAAEVVLAHDAAYDPPLLDSICSALAKAGLHEKAGDLYAHLRRYEEARDAYCRGCAYRKAVELARHEFPAEVIVLEEEWGDWLMGVKQLDAAINHYIEAGQSVKAVEAALECRQFAKAAGIIEFLDSASAGPYYKRIASHFERAKSYEEAERYYIKADAASSAVEMYNRVGKWEQAHKIAMGYLTDGEMHSLYTRRAREMEAASKFKEAERMYLTISEPDLAINMYKKALLYDHMIRLVSLHRKDLLAETHGHLAQQLESDGSLKEAERHYAEGGDWKGAVHMYRSANMWEEALRVAKTYGGVNASKQVAYAWAVSLGGDEGAQLLKALGLIDQAIDYAVESGAFAHAFQLARSCGSGKLPDVHLKYAMYLEDEGRFKEAEQEFISAGRRFDLQLWENAVNVAMTHQRNRLHHVVDTVSHNLMRIGRYEAAAELHEGIDDVQGAAKAYCLGGNFEKARAVAGGNAGLRAFVEERYNQHLVSNRNADALASRGQAAQALEMYAQQGEWDKVYALAEAQGPGVSAKCAARHARLKVRQGEFCEAASILATRGTDADPSNLDLYCHIARQVLELPQAQRSDVGERGIALVMRRLLEEVRNSGSASTAAEAELTRLSWAAHYLSMVNVSIEEGWEEMAAKQATSLLRYIDVVPADKVAI